MKWIISLVLVLLIGILTYLLILNIQEPIAFEKIKNKRKDAVVDRLEEIRQAQELYRAITGEFAGSFDTLIHVLKTDSIEFIKIEGDPDNPDNDEFIRTVIYTPAIDSVRALNLNLDSLPYVPNAAPGTTFSIQADTLTYQSTLVSVVEVGTRWKEFMGKYASRKYSKYDDSYDPDKMIKFGDMNAPNLSGNW